MAPWECFGQISLNYSSVGMGAEEQDDSVREHKASFSAVVYNFNSSLLATADTGFSPIAVPAKGQRTKRPEWGGGGWQIRSLEGSGGAEGW